MMRHFSKISIIILINWIFSPNVIYTDLNRKALKNEESVTSKITEKFVSKYQFEAGYNEAIDYIKKHEGFNGGEIYNDVAGIKTVGHGHVILDTDTFTTTMSKETADRLLRKDFEKAIKAAERETNLTGYKKIAIAHFIFAKGVGNLEKVILKN